jgi:exopolysaccharide biosynthesis glucuronosyltransferase PssE
VIFVTVGTNEARFDRLLEAVATLPGSHKIVVQHGSSSVQPANAAQCFEFLPFDDLVGKMRSARVVVTHAGIGSIMTALACGKRPIVVPRLARYGEAVDDHQLPVARRLESAGLVRVVEDLSSLEAAVLDAVAVVDVAIGADQRLVGELRDYIAAHTGDRDYSRYPRLRRRSSTDRSSPGS